MCHQITDVTVRPFHQETPQSRILTLLQKLQESEEKLSTIIVSAYGDIANIRTAMNRGRSIS